MLCVCVCVGGKTDGAGMEGGGRDDIRESKRRRGGKGGKDGGKEGGREIDKSNQLHFRKFSDTSNKKK